MQSVIVELDTVAQLEALKKYIHSLGAKMRTLKNDDVQNLSTNEEMKAYGTSLRKHSSEVLADFVQNETESMF
jgi:hypothetical protein